MKTYTDFARYGNPTPQQVLGIHFDLATDGELKYLNLNTTYNSSILLNYRQTESAFWTQVRESAAHPTVSLSVFNVRAFFALFAVFTDCDWCAGAHISTVDRILVGAT